VEIAFFDFDGTISFRDTLFDFIRYSRGNREFAAGMAILLPGLLRFKCGRISAAHAKEMVLSHFFRGMTATDFSRAAHRYALERLPGIVRPGALARIRSHQEKTHTVVVVSAAIDQWLAPWCGEYGIHLLATGLEYRHNRITGRLKGPNCNGPEKVIRIRQKFDLTRYTTIHAYGDSAGDREMLAMADAPNFRPFR